MKRQGGFLLFLFCFSAAAYAAAEAPCGPTDWFRYNLKTALYKPWLDSLSIVLYANGKNFEHKQMTRDVQTCEEAGITNGFHVIQVLFKMYMNVLPSFLYTVEHLSVFDICTEQMSKYDFDKEQVLKHNREAQFHMRDCAMATRMFHCAAFNVSWTLPWLACMGAVGMFLCLLPLFALLVWVCRN